MSQAFQCGVQACRTRTHDDHFFGIGFHLRPSPRLDLGFAGAFVPPHQQLHPDRALSCIPALAEDVQFRARVQSRTTLLAQLAFDSRPHHLGLRHFLGQDPNLDL